MPNISRRQLLKAAATTGLALPFAGRIARAADPEDYKAIVCLYLEGGCDHLAVLTPADTSNFNALYGIRPQLLVGTNGQPAASLEDARAALAAWRIDSGLPKGGREVALHPRLANVKRLYETEKRLAFINGIGELDQPVTKQDLVTGRIPISKAAGSHNDGNCYTHALAYEEARYGWGGRMADALASRNASRLFTSVAVCQNFNAFGSGVQTLQFRAPYTGGTRSLAGVDQEVLFGSRSAPAALRRQLGEERTNHLEAAYIDVNRQIFDSNGVASKVFAETQSFLPFTYAANVPYFAGRDNDTAAKLRTVARLMSKRQELGASRQIFFVDQVAFDTHGGQVGAMDAQMHKLDLALEYFDRALGTLGLRDKVILVTTSEFGRGLGGNGDGTGHGWGGFSMVMGGAIKGGNIFGPLADISLDSNHFYGDYGGSLIPEIPPEQLGATLARWFGVPESDIAQIFPRLRRFAPDLGFLA